MVWYPIVLRILRLSAAGSITIAVVLLARLLLKKVPRWLSYALWLVVLVRLLIPFSFEGFFGVVPKSLTQLDEKVYYPAYEQVTPTAAADAALRTVGDTLNGGLGTVYVRLTPDPTADSPEIIPSTSASHRQIWPLVLTALWPLGVLAMAVYALVSYIRLRRKLIGAVQLKGNVYLADGIPSPFVLGMFRPKIYLPSNLTPTETEYILLHERTHLSHLDHITRPLAFLALTVHWFNPLVWLAFVVSGMDMEIACDEEVLDKAGADIRADYAQSLLNLSTGRVLIAATPLAFGEGNVKGRIKGILRYKKPRMAAVICGLLLLSFLNMALLTDRAVHTDDDLLQYFNEEFFANTADAMSDPQRSFRNHFTTCYYSIPEQINYKSLFYDGLPGGQVFRTQEDVEAMDAADYASPEVQAYFDEYGPICPIYQGTLAQMDAVILEYTGADMDSFFRRGSEEFQHINGSLYWANGDTNCGPLEFFDLTREEDLIHLYYNQTTDGLDILTLRETAEGYQFVSNLHEYADTTALSLQDYLGWEETDIEIIPVTFTRDPRWEADYDLIGFTSQYKGVPRVGYALVWRTPNGNQIQEAQAYGLINPISYDPVTDIVYGNVVCGNPNRPLERNTFFLCFSNDPDLAHIRVTANGETYWEQDISAPLVLAIPVIDIMPDVHIYFTDINGDQLTERQMTWSDLAYQQTLSLFSTNINRLLDRD